MLSKNKQLVSEIETGVCLNLNEDSECRATPRRELPVSRAKASSKISFGKILAAISLWATASICNISFAQTSELPTGAQVVKGQASISQSGNTLTVNQTSARADIDWQTFNIGIGNQVNIHQPGPDSISLNRVIGGSQTTIAGRLYSTIIARHATPANER